MPLIGKTSLVPPQKLLRWRALRSFGRLMRACLAVVLTAVCNCLLGGYGVGQGKDSQQCERCSKVVTNK